MVGANDVGQYVVRENIRRVLIDAPEFVGRAPQGGTN